MVREPAAPPARGTARIRHEEMPHHASTRGVQRIRWRDVALIFRHAIGFLIMRSSHVDGGRIDAGDDSRETATRRQYQAGGQ